MEGLVDLGYPAMYRPGVEPAISRSQVQRPNHYTTEQPNTHRRRRRDSTAELSRVGVGGTDR